MNTDNTITEDLKTRLIEVLADYLSAVSKVSQQSVLTLGVSIYKNTNMKGDTQLQQSAKLINILDEQINNGNDDVLTKDIVQEIFTNILQKLTTGVEESPTILFTRSQ